MFEKYFGYEAIAFEFKYISSEKHLVTQGWKILIRFLIRQVLQQFFGWISGFSGPVRKWSFNKSFEAFTGTLRQSVLNLLIICPISGHFVYIRRHIQNRNNVLKFESLDSLCSAKNSKIIFVALIEIGRE